MADPAFPTKRDGVVPWEILGLGCFAIILALYSWNLGVVELSDVDESRSGVIVRDMVEGGHWLLPRTPDGHLSEKPPVYYGTCAALVSFLGRDEAVFRGVSVAAALGTLVIVARLTRLYGSSRAACVAVVALASNFFFARCARQAMVDMTLTFFLTAGFAAYFAARLGRLRPWPAAAICGFSFGLAVLTKGPLGLALPIAVVGGDALITSRGRIWRLSIPWAPGAFALSITIALPLVWYVSGYHAGGSEFLYTCLMGENFRMPLGLKATAETSIIVSHRKPFPYYFWNQAIALLPMLPLLPEAVRFLMDRVSGPARAHFAAWAGFGFLVFLAAANKRHYYLVPIQPAFAVLIGLATDALLAERRRPALSWGQSIVGLALALGSLGCIVLTIIPGALGRFLPVELVDPVRRNAPAILVLAALGMAISGWLLRGARRHPPAIVGPALALALLTLAVNSIVESGVKAEFNGMKPFVANMLARIPPDAKPVVLAPLHSLALDFYWPEPLVRVDEAAGREEYVFVQRPYLDRVGRPYEILGSMLYGSSDHDVFLIRKI
jgi:4-amino-4-deoxy-L-arabinose transferase-like glycosyltransferase